MKQGTTLPLLAISMAATALAGEPHVRREGAFWVEVVQATETLPTSRSAATNERIFMHHLRQVRCNEIKRKKAAPSPSGVRTASMW